MKNKFKKYYEKIYNIAIESKNNRNFHLADILILVQRPHTYS